MTQTYKCAPTDSFTPPSIPQEDSVLECSLDNPPFPSCRIDQDIYLDADFSGNYSEGDIVLSPDGAKYTKEEVQKKLKNLGYDPDFAGCFYASAPSCFSDMEELRIKYGMWPERFTVLTATEWYNKSWGVEFLNSLNISLNTAMNPEETRRVFQHYAHDHPFIAYGGFLSLDSQYSVGRIGKQTGWFYNPDTLQQDALLRYLIVIQSNDISKGRQASPSMESSVERIANKYRLPQDHIHWVRAPRYESTLRRALQRVADQIPDGQEHEVMIIYDAHGDNAFRDHHVIGWETLLHNGLLWDTVLSERKFRDLMIGNFSSKKIASAILIINSCNSGTLVEPKPTVTNR